MNKAKIDMIDFTLESMFQEFLEEYIYPYLDGSKSLGDLFGY